MAERHTLVSISLAAEDMSLPCQQPHLIISRGYAPRTHVVAATGISVDGLSTTPHWHVGPMSSLA